MWLRQAPGEGGFSEAGPAYFLSLSETGPGPVSQDGLAIFFPSMKGLVTVPTLFLSRDIHNKKGLWRRPSWRPQTSEELTEILCVFTGVLEDTEVTTVLHVPESLHVVVLLGPRFEKRDNVFGET